MKIKNRVALILATATFLPIPLIAANLNAVTTSNKRVENSKLKLGMSTRNGSVPTIQLVQNNDAVETPAPNQGVDIPDSNLMPTSASSGDALRWQPDSKSQKLIDAAEPGSILIFVQQDGDEAPRLVSTSGVTEGVTVKALVAQGVPAVLGCLMNINTPQNNPPGKLTHRATITCTNRTTYLRGKICPEFSRNGQWMRQNDVCTSSQGVFLTGLAVEKVSVCANGTLYRTWGEVRADFINQTDTDSGEGRTQFCRF